LTIILFELFSGINPFPGRIEQIFEAKRIDTKPTVPSDFPAALKDLILQGWSKDPKERPQLDTFKLALNKVMGDNLHKSTSEKDQQAAFPTSKSNVGNDKTEENKSALNKTLVNEDNKSASFGASKTKVETFKSSKEEKDQQAAFQTSRFNLEVEKTEENKVTLRKMLVNDENKGTSFAASRTILETFMNSKKANEQQKAFPTLKSNLEVEKTKENNSDDLLSGNKDNSPHATSIVSREPPKWIRNVKTASNIRLQETEKETEGVKNITLDQTLPTENKFLSQTAENVSYKVQNRISQFEDIFASNTLKKTNERREKQTVVEELSKAQGMKQEALLSPPPPSLPTTPPSPSPPPQLNKAQEIKQEALLSPSPTSPPTTPPHLNKAQEIKQEALVSLPPPLLPTNPPPPSPPPQLNKAQEIKQEALVSPPPPSLPTTPPPPSPPPQLNKAQEIKQEALVSPPPPTTPPPPTFPAPPSTLPQMLQQQHQQQAPMKAQKAKQEHHNDVTCTDIESGILFISYFKIFSKYSQT
jgi:hypothetical protein